MLVLDEAHKLRNLYGVDPPPQVAVRIRNALADRRFAYVLMLTATPIQNRLWDLYSLVDLLTSARLSMATCPECSAGTPSSISRTASSTFSASSRQPPSLS